MNICFLAGANSVHSYKWVKYFADKGHQVHWISFTKNTQGIIEGVPFYEINAFFPFNFLKLRKIVKKIKPDIFHAHYAGVNGFLAALVGFHPFVITAWGSDVLIAGKAILKKIFVKYALNRADLITCDAGHMQKAIVKLGEPASKIKIIYFGVDVLKFSEREKNTNLQNKLKVSNCPVVISLRSFERVYDIETLIMAIPIVLSVIPNVKFIIAGKGPEEENLKKLAENLNILENIRFVSWIAQGEMPEYLRLADIYVSTSLSDAGIASSTAEAMACGVCPIITDFGDNKEWVKNGENGFLMPLRDHDFLADKLVYLLKNSEERLKLGHNARSIIEEKNNYYKEMEKMDKLYEIISKKY